MERSPLPSSPKGVPRLGALRASLNYDKHKPYGPVFWKYLCSFREMHSTASGVSATHFHQWTDSTHLDALFEIVDFFLQRENTGSAFWPDDISHPKHNSLQISAHRPTIRRLLVQVFWRLNSQAVSNNRYKESKQKKANNNDPSKDSPRPTETGYQHPAVTSESPRGTTSNAEVASDSTRPLSGLSGPSIQHRGDSARDPWVVPDSPRACVRDGQSSFPVREPDESTSSRKRRSTKAKEPTAKRRRKAKFSATSDSARQRHKRPQGQLPVRNSPRTRKPLRSDPTMATESELDEATRFMSPTPESNSSAPSDDSGQRAHEDLCRDPVREEVETTTTVRPPSPIPNPAPFTAEDNSFTAELQEGMRMMRGIFTEDEDVTQAPSIPSINMAPTNSTRDSPGPPASGPQTASIPSGSQEATNGSLPLLPSYLWPTAEHYHVDVHGAGNEAIGNTDPSDSSPETFMVSFPLPISAKTQMLRARPASSSVPVAPMGIDEEPHHIDQVDDPGASRVSRLVGAGVPWQEHPPGYMSSTRCSSETVNWPREQGCDLPSRYDRLADQDLRQSLPVVRADSQLSVHPPTAPSSCVTVRHLPEPTDQRSSTDRALDGRSPTYETPSSNMFPNQGIDRLDSTKTTAEATQSPCVSQEPAQERRESEFTSEATHADKNIQESIGSQSVDDWAVSSQTTPLKKGAKDGKRLEASTSGATPQFSFIVVHTRRPSVVSKQWIPNGKFLGKTLSQLMAELPGGFANDCLGLTFRWRGPGVAVEFDVHHGDDGMFDFMRKNIRAELRESIRNHTNDEVLSFRVEIEGLQKVVEEMDDEDELC